MEKRITRLQDHFVVAGSGRTGRHVVEELIAVERPFVIIDRDEAKLERMSAESSVPLLYIVGNATEDHTLLEAGVDRAEGVVAALTGDPDNLFVTLSVRALNPRARIVAKVVDSDNEPKLIRAGADTTVNPTRIGGLRLVSELVRPRVTAFLDEMMRTTKNIRFEELGIAPDSHFVGQTLRTVPIRSETRVLVVALHLPDGKFVYNPAPDGPLIAGTKLIVMGDSEGVEKLRKMISAA